MMPVYTLRGTEVVPIEDVSISVLSGVVNYGLGCFEGIRAYWNDSEKQLYVFRLQDHLRRLQSSGEILHIRLPDNIDSISLAICELLRAENCREDVYIRPLAYKDNLKLGSRLDRLDDAILTWVTPITDDPRYERGLKVTISDTRRINADAVPSEAKLTGTYINPILARTNAQIAGYDDCILLNSSGNVAEGSGWNILLIKDQTLVTPALSEGILEGLTRDALLSVARLELNLIIEEREVTPEELFSADEIIACGTGIQILPIVEIDEVKIGDGQAGRRCQEFWKIYCDIIRHSNANYEAWLTPVYSETS
jgi:branched-chain amino acid aminotransferase